MHFLNPKFSKLIFSNTHHDTIPQKYHQLQQPRFNNKSITQFIQSNIKYCLTFSQSNCLRSILHLLIVTKTMSFEKLKDFLEIVKNNGKLHEKLKSAQSAEEVEKIANEHGHEFSTHGFNNLSDKELESVAGGGCSTCMGDSVAQQTQSFGPTNTCCHKNCGSGYSW